MGVEVREERDGTVALRQWAEYRGSTVLDAYGAIKLLDLDAPGDPRSLEAQAATALAGAGFTGQVVYMPMIEVAWHRRGAALGLEVMRRLATEAADRWPGTPLVALCIERLLRHWARVGCTPVEAPAVNNRYHLFRIPTPTEG